MSFIFKCVCLVANVIFKLKPPKLNHGNSFLLAFVLLKRVLNYSEHQTERTTNMGLSTWKMASAWAAAAVVRIQIFSER